MPSSVVVDASIAVQWIAQEPGTESATRLVRANVLLVAPDIMPIEAANACWKKAQRGDMPAVDAEPALATLLAFGLELVPSLGLLSRALRLAVELQHPIYDCLYLALASGRGAPIATADAGLRRVAERVGLGLWRR